jgi:hypothetical protein
MYKMKGNKMKEMIFELLGHLAAVLADLYQPGKEIGAVIAAFLSVLIFHKTAYKILGFFFTRKFKPARKKHPATINNALYFRFIHIAAFLLLNTAFTLPNIQHTNR